MSDLRTRLRQSRVIAVLIIDRVEDAVPLAKALVEGGVDAMELTLRTPAALGALREVATEVPEILAGMGTILTTEQLEQVIEAGATFGVSPGLNPRVLQEATRRGFPFYPGAVTPTEIERAIELGCDVIKFFPSEPSGGLDYLRSIAAPYDHLDVKYIPLGGIGPTNLASYLEEDRVLAVGGSWIASRALIQQQDWKAITNNARQARDQVNAFAQRTVG